MWLLLGCHAAGTLVTGAESAPDSSLVDGETGLRDSGGADTARDGDTSDTGRDTSDTGSPAVTWPEAGPSCTSWGEPVMTGTVADVALEEISGVAVSFQNPGVLWVIEDHGNPAEIVGLDTAGSTVATLALEIAENDDWEDVLLVPCGAGACLVVADTGNNSRDRETFSFLVVPEPLLDGRTTSYTAVPEAYAFSYPDLPEDVEAVGLTDGGAYYLFSKRTDNTSGVYQLPALVDGAVATSLATSSPGRKSRRGRRVRRPARVSGPGRIDSCSGPTGARWSSSRPTVSTSSTPSRRSRSRRPPSTTTRR